VKRRTIFQALMVTALVIWPLIPKVPHDLLNTAIITFQYLIAALSLVLLIGLVGQISLCQAALVGMGAFIGAIATQNLGIQFPFTLLVGMAAGTLTATIIGLVALRVRGLYLAVATLIFAYVADQYLFVQPWLVKSRSGVSIGFQHIGLRGALPYFDLSNAKVFYYAALAVGVISLYMVANLRDSRLGRAFAAIRGSEVAAASLGINVTRFKLLGFACAGALAGLGGGLTLIAQRTVSPEQFNFTNSLNFLAIAVVGGLRSLGGAVASALLFGLLVGEVFFRRPDLANYLDLISAGLLIAVLLFFRGGLGALSGRFRAAGVFFETRFSSMKREMGTSRAGKFPSRRPSSQPRETYSRRSVRRPSLRARLVAGGGTSGAMPASGGEVAIAPGQARGSAPAIVKSIVSIVLPGKAKAPATSEPPMAGHAPVDVIGLVDRLIPSQEPEAPPAVVTELPTERNIAAEGDIRKLIKAAAGQHVVAGMEGDGGRRIPVLLSADEITVKFGGLTAVNDASIKVGAGEIIGLIGPNGAGKTTLFNSILGLNQPTQGTVHLFGQDVTSWGVHQRAALGVGRTFQVLQLFPELTVFDNLLVATHLQNPTGLAGALVVTPGAVRHEAAARHRVEAVLRLMEMEHLANRQVAGLPFGVLRLIEVARTLVAGARLVCFDEPASGLDSAETEKLIEWFRLLRQIGITLLVIEHDVSMVVRLCDYIYVLDQGKLISEGTPGHIQGDPAVIASYLGGAPVEVA
jgi:branched-chain amino acid transport system ATP-binding protein